MEMDALSAPMCCRNYMSALFKIRLVAELWKETLDGSPCVWAIASSTLPVQQNASNIQRSGEWPLTIHYIELPASLECQREILSNIIFLQLTKPTLSRWKVAYFDKVEIDAVFQPLDRSATLLQELSIHSQTFISPGTEHYLFGGQLPNIRHLDLEGISLPASLVPFGGLTFLELGQVFDEGIAADRLFDIVEGNPGLEHLSLAGLGLQISPALATKATI
ncbi:hypothetical protein M407DRAFT_30550, partial [Tulasnella calospora MUT 4182]